MSIFKGKEELEISNDIVTWLCIDCEIETNYSCEGVCYWCFKQMSLKHDIKYFQEQIDALQKRKRLVKLVNEEEEK